MPEEQARSPTSGGGENQAEEPAKTVYFVPIYAVAVVDPNKHIGKSRLPLDDQRQWNVGSSENISANQRGVRGKAAEPEVAVQQKRQKLIVMRKRGRVPEYDDDDPHKPTPKRLRNRMKAQKSRDKKKAYMNALEIRVKELEKINSELEERCLCLQIENEALKNEALDSGPGAREEVMHYYEKLQKDKENILKKFVDNQGYTSGESAENPAGTPEKCTRITGHEEAHVAEFGERATPETAVEDQGHTIEMCTEVNDHEGSQRIFVEADGQEGTAGKFAEVEYQEVTSKKSMEVDAEEDIPEKFVRIDAQDGTMRWTDVENSTISYLEDGVEQDSVLERSQTFI